MRVLVALPDNYTLPGNIDKVIDGSLPSSGTIGSFVRAADLIRQAGHTVSISAHSVADTSGSMSCLSHKDVQGDQYDVIIAHQTLWNAEDRFLLGNSHLPRTILWFQNQSTRRMVRRFFEEGGKRLVCVSRWHSDNFRSLSAWQDRIHTIYNTYNSFFTEKPTEQENVLLFVGAITVNKGFDSVMQMWSSLAAKNVPLKLRIAGGIQLHKGSSVEVGPIGVAERDFEVNEIVPWRDSLPTTHKPEFLGPINVEHLREEMLRSWAVLVNPSWQAKETFCVSAVEAEACGRSVFSVAAGGLNETVYQRRLQTLSSQRDPAHIGDLILQALQNPERLVQNSNEARQYVETEFGQARIQKDWVDIINDVPQKQKMRISDWQDNSLMIKDILRVTGTGRLMEMILKR